MHKVTEANPCAANCCRMISRMVYRSPIGTSGFGSAVVYGRSRTPLPPARITACIVVFLPTVK